jgi:anti-sigma factor RsiW
MNECPPEERLLQALLDTLEPEARTELTTHLARCDSCRERWQHHRSLGYGTPASDESTPPSCPQPVDAISLVEGNLGVAAARDARTHILDCPHCYRRLDTAIQQIKRQRRETSDDASSRSWTRGWLGRLRGRRG